MSYARDTMKVRSEFREGGVRLVRETGKSIAWVARNLGVNWAPWEMGEQGSNGVNGSVLVLMNGPSWSVCARRTLSCGWSATF